MKSFSTMRYLAGIGVGVMLPEQRDMAAAAVGNAMLPVAAAEVAVVPPFANDSIATQDELRVVQEAMRRHGKATKFDAEVDRNSIAPFEAYVERVGLRLPAGWLQRLAASALPLLLALKFRYNRPRPKALAFMYGLDLVPFASKTADSPSYPSGHAFQAYLAAGVLARLRPQDAEELYGLAARVAQSRINLGLHFPSDVEYGQALAQSVALTVPMPPTG